MSLLSPRRSRAVAVTASAAVLVVGASLVIQASPAYAAVTISAVAPSKVAAGLANRVVVITGTNFDEDLIASIALNATDCAALTSYVVTSATQISVKTPLGGCTATVSTAETVTITAVDLTTVSKATAITFVAPPSIAAVGTKPVITQNSSALLAANQVVELNAAGNQVIRIKAGAAYAFAGTSGALAGSVGGKALTTVGFVSAAGVAQTTPTAGDVGNTWIAKTGTGMTASVTPALTITQGSVSRTFTNLETGLSGIVALPTVTSLDVKEGVVDAPTVVKITGTNFGTVPGDLSVTFCGVAGTLSVSTPPTATSITLTTPPVAGLSPGLGASNFSGVCPVVVTRTAVGSSSVTATSFFAFLDR
jgi:IPT/TIG domain-containing protein